VSVASLLPKDVNLNTDPCADLSDEQLLERIDQLDGQVAPQLAGVAGRKETADRVAAMKSHGCGAFGFTTFGTVMLRSA
jgi:hypothetical protein